MSRPQKVLTAKRPDRKIFDCQIPDRQISDRQIPDCQISDHPLSPKGRRESHRWVGTDACLVTSANSSLSNWVSLISKDKFKG